MGVRVPGGAPTCFAPSTLRSRETGCWWLIGASLVHMCAGHAIMHAVKTAVEEFELGVGHGGSLFRSSASGAAATAVLLRVWSNLL